MTDAVEVTLSHRRTKGERRQKVLQHLAGMLNEATLEKITTARIAEAMDISEGLLYRYFKNKADMFDALIDFAEESLMGLTGQIRASEGMSGLDQVRASVNVMLQFADANPGITRVMTGQVLVYEDPRLIERVSRLHLALEAGLKLSYRTAVAEGACRFRCVRQGVPPDGVRARPVAAFCADGFQGAPRAQEQLRYGALPEALSRETEDGKRRSRIVSRPPFLISAA